MKLVDARLFAAGIIAPLMLAFPTPFVRAAPPARAPAPPPRLGYLPSARPNTSASGITVRASYDDPIRPVIYVTFVTPLSVPFSNVVEYHVYRNETLVGRFTRANLVGYGSRVTFQDIGSTMFITPVSNTTVNYVTVNIGDLSQLSDARSLGVPLFPAGKPIVYRVTLLQATEGVGGRPIYVETEVGKSSQITPFR